jgi:hypothetical protein
MKRVNAIFCFVFALMCGGWGFTIVFFSKNRIKMVGFLRLAGIQ